MDVSLVPDEGYIDGIAQEERITEFSEDQERAIEFAKKFLDGKEKYKVIGGVAGSGKSTIIPYIASLCGEIFSQQQYTGSVAVCAYTGKAVMNLKRKGITGAMTLHSFLYNTIFVKDPKTGDTTVQYVPRESFFFQQVRLLIVDESSMLPKDMFEQISKLPFQTIYIGDHYQLPPVNNQFNIMLKPDFKLERIHRQNEDNPIIMLADMVRHGKSLALGVFGSSKVTRTCKREHLKDFDEVITWTNAMKDVVNDIIREGRGFQKDVPQIDDKMVVRVNNRNKNVFNGQIVYLMNHPVLTKGGGWKVEFIDELAYDDPFLMVLTDEYTKAIASIHLSRQELERIRTTPYVNVQNKNEWRALKKSKGDYQVHLDWGYAITCHTAQGTSWKSVAVILEDRMKRVMEKEEMNRWLYTAITRAEESVTIYNIDKI